MVYLWGNRGLLWVRTQGVCCGLWAELGFGGCSSFSSLKSVAAPRYIFPFGSRRSHKPGGLLLFAVVDVISFIQAPYPRFRHSTNIIILFSLAKPNHAQPPPPPPRVPPPPSYAVSATRLLKHPRRPRSHFFCILSGRCADWGQSIFCLELISQLLSRYPMRWLQVQKVILFIAEGVARLCANH